MSIEYSPSRRQEKRSGIDPDIKKRIRQAILLDNRFDITNRIGLATNTDKSLAHGYVADGMLRRKISINEQLLRHPKVVEAKKLPFSGILPRHLENINKKDLEVKEKISTIVAKHIQYNYPENTERARNIELAINELLTHNGETEKRTRTPLSFGSISINPNPEMLEAWGDKWREVLNKPE